MKKFTVVFSFLGILFFAASCTYSPRKTIKPFIIIDKSVFGIRYAHYTYEDSLGYETNFDDFETTYKIGDTIK